MQAQKTAELFRVQYAICDDTTSGMTPFHDEWRETFEIGVIHVRAGNLDEAKKAALEELGPRSTKYGIGSNIKISIDDRVSVANFADIWRDQTNEELFNRYVAHVERDRENHDGNKLGFYERRAAARILSRGKHQPAGEILLNWLNNPQAGIGNYCCGYKNSAAPNKWPDDYLFSDDATPGDIVALAAESLGLMGYEPAAADLERLAEDEGIRKNDPRLCFTIYSALNRVKAHIASHKRYDEKREIIRWWEAYPGKGEEFEPDILLFIAATSPKEFFRTSLFKAMAKHVMESAPRYWLGFQHTELTERRNSPGVWVNPTSTELAERYIEALRRVPDLEIPIIDEERVQKPASGSDIVMTPKIDLTSFLARRGLNIGIENLERVCAEILDITRNGEGLGSGSSVYLDIALFDGTTALVNDGSRKRIRQYLEQNHLFFHGGVID